MKYLILILFPFLLQAQSLLLFGDVADPYGEELAVNGTFTVGTGWTFGAMWEISGGQLVGLGGVGDVTQANTNIIEGKTYHAVFTVTFTGGNAQILIKVGGTQSAWTYSWVTPEGGTFTYDIIAGADQSIAFQNATGNEMTIDNVSVKEVLNP